MRFNWNIKKGLRPIQFFQLNKCNCSEPSQNPAGFEMWRIRHMHLHRFILMYASIQHIKPLQMRMALNSYK